MTLALLGAGPTSGVAAFDPVTALSPVAYWAADAITGKVDGDAVSSWIDSSGNSRPAVQATGANQPLYKTNSFNSLPAVLFDGVNDCLTAVAFALNGGSAPAGVSMCIVANRTAAGNFPMGLVWHDTANELRANSTGGKMEFNVNATGSGTGTGVDLTGATAHVIVGTFDDTSNACKVYVDGTKVVDTTVAVTLTTTAQPATIGARSSAGSPWTGRFGMAMLGNRAWTDPEVASLSAAMKTKWGTP